MFNFRRKVDVFYYILTETFDDWMILETKKFQDYIKSNGYDSFLTHESDVYNIAVYNPCNIKKANGNVTFDKNNPNVNK
jgi:hypothetical protein